MVIHEQCKSGLSVKYDRNLENDRMHIKKGNLKRKRVVSAMTPVLNMKMSLSKKSNWAGQLVVWSKNTPLKSVLFGSV